VETRRVVRRRSSSHLRDGCGIVSLPLSFLEISGRKESCFSYALTVGRVCTVGLDGSGSLCVACDGLNGSVGTRRCPAVLGIALRVLLTTVSLSVVRPRTSGDFPPCHPHIVVVTTARRFASCWLCCTCSSHERPQCFTSCELGRCYQIS
jgi:hypothetical protein